MILMFWGCSEDQWDSRWDAKEGNTSEIFISQSERLDLLPSEHFPLPNFSAHGFPQALHQVTDEAGGSENGKGVCGVVMQSQRMTWSLPCRREFGLFKALGLHGAK